MGKLSDAIDQATSEIRQGGKCGVGLLLRQLPDDLRRDIELHLDPASLTPHTSIARGLRILQAKGEIDAGKLPGVDAVTRHRKNECKCAFEGKP